MVIRKARCGQQGGTRTREGGGCQDSAKNTKKKTCTPTEAEGVVSDVWRLPAKREGRESK
jgi:hypothetical protein